MTTQDPLAALREAIESLLVAVTEHTGSPEHRKGYSHAELKNRAMRVSRALAATPPAIDRYAQPFGRDADASGLPDPWPATPPAIDPVWGQGLVGDLAIGSRRHGLPLVVPKVRKP